MIPLLVLSSFSGGPLNAQTTAIDALEGAKIRAASTLGREDAPFILIAESSMRKVMPDRAPFTGRPGRPVEISLAGGETEAAQIIIAPLNQALRDVTFSVSPLVRPDGASLPDSAVRLEVVGYVQTEPQEDLMYEVDRIGWFPDPILPFIRRFDIERGRVQSLWLTIRAEIGQPPGVYSGTVTVTPGNAPEEAIPVRVRVFDFSVPTQRSFRATVATFDDFLQQMYGDRWNEDLYWRYASFLHDHRVDMDSFYRDHGPPPSVEQIERLAAMGQQGWGLRFIRQPGVGFSDVGPDSADYPAYLDEAIGDAKASLAVLEEAGARHLAYLYLYDEVREEHFEVLKSTVRRLREELPGVPIWTSAYDPEFGATSGLDEVIDVWVAGIHLFDMPEELPKIEAARGKGAQVFWYTTIWPPRPFPNFFIEYDAIEPRLIMGAMTQKFRPDAFGYWAINFWQFQESPVSDGPYTDWNPLGTPNGNGAGVWILPGEDGPLTTIRFENFRDGLEDFEYYQILAKAVARGEKEGAPRDLLDRARALLDVPEEVVRGLKEFTRDPLVLERHRMEVAEAIQELNRASEG